jgi:hypothetical protein
MKTFSTGLAVVLCAPDFGWDLSLDLGSEREPTAPPVAWE